MEHTILFETEKSTFHLWPLDYYGWRGFFSKSHVVVTEEDIMVEFKGVFKNTFRLDELEFCNVKKRWLGYANSQLSVGVNDREWQNSDKYKKEYEKLLKRERENEKTKMRQAIPKTQKIMDGKDDDSIIKMRGVICHKKISIGLSRF